MALICCIHQPQIPLMILCCTDITLKEIAAQSKQNMVEQLSCYPFSLRELNTQCILLGLVTPRTERSNTFTQRQNCTYIWHPSSCWQRNLPPSESKAPSEGITLGVSGWHCCTFGRFSASSALSLAGGGNETQVAQDAPHICHAQCLHCDLSVC